MLTYSAAFIIYNGENVNFRSLCEIVQARVEEIIRLIVLDLPREKYADLVPSGIVITGGCANIPGIAEVAEKLTRLPVRVGVPAALSGVSIEALVIRPMLLVWGWYFTA